MSAEQKYSKDAVYAITKAYGSKYETAKKEFTLDDPESISSRDELSVSFSSFDIIFILSIIFKNYLFFLIYFKNDDYLHRNIFMLYFKIKKYFFLVIKKMNTKFIIKL